jgi:uncharacterized protein (DUF58 family)
MNRIFRLPGKGTEKGSRRGADGPPHAAGDGAHVSVDELIRLRLLAPGLAPGSRRVVSTALAGVHRSRFRGRGMDYQESRSYQPGDDIRNMDWRVTARAGRPHTKLYQEERERPVVVVVDLGPSMFFGTQGAFKTVIAARAAALIGWAAVRNGDRIGAVLFNGRHHEIPPRGGHPGVLRLIRQLVGAIDPEQPMSGIPEEGGLTGALRRLRRVARPGSLIVILSDFHSMDAQTGNHLMRLRQHNDIVACQIVDVLELAPPAPGRYGITDGERRGILDTRSPAQRDAYARVFTAHHEAVRALMERFAIPLLRIRTTDDVAGCLRRDLVAAMRGRSAGGAAA